jgi:hypothetical protein
VVAVGSVGMNLCGLPRLKLRLQGLQDAPNASATLTPTVLFYSPWCMSNEKEPKRRPSLWVGSARPA